MSSRASPTKSFKTWAKSFTSNPTAVGKTAGTYGEMGVIKIPNKQEKLYLYGFLVAVVSTIQTAGESGFPIMKVDSSDVGLINETFPLPKLGFTDPIGTNSQFVVKPAVFVPIEVIHAVNNKSFSISFTSNATMTANWQGYVSAIFGNKPKNALPSGYALELISGFASFTSSLGRHATPAASAIGTAFVDIALNDITIPAKAKQLTSIMAMVLPNAPTATEEISALFTFNAGDISDFGPQEYPACLCYEPTLGTVVGGANGLQTARGYPVRFPLPGTEFSFSAKIRNILALTNPPDELQACEFRSFEPR